MYAYLINQVLLLSFNTIFKFYLGQKTPYNALFCKLIKVIKVAADKGVCCKEKHLPRNFMEKRSKEDAFATDKHGITRNKTGKEANKMHLPRIYTEKKGIKAFSPRRRKERKGRQEI